MNELVLTAKALSDPSRVRILMALRQGELCVCELCDALAITQSTLSTHLQVIRNAGLVSARKQGKWMYYALAPKAESLVSSFFRTLSPSLDKDVTLRRDATKLTKRLTLRDKGLCCVGFESAKNCCTPAK